MKGKYYKTAQRQKPFTTYTTIKRTPVDIEWSVFSITKHLLLEIFEWVYLTDPLNSGQKLLEFQVPSKLKKRSPLGLFWDHFRIFWYFEFHASDFGLNEDKDLTIEISLAEYTGNTQRCRHAFLPYVGHINLYYLYSGCMYNGTQSSIKKTIDLTSRDKGAFFGEFFFLFTRTFIKT